MPVRLEKKKKRYLMVTFDLFHLSTVGVRVHTVAVVVAVVGAG